MKTVEENIDKIDDSYQCLFLHRKIYYTPADW